jgi:hypothetical protein
MSETMGGVVQRLMAQHDEAVARAERAEALLLDALRFNNDNAKAAHEAQVDAEALASLLQDSDAMRRALRSRAEQAEKELGLWRAETGAGRPEDAGAAIRNIREDLRQAESLAYIGDGRFPDQTWKARCVELVEDLRKAERERDEARRLHGKAVLDGSAAVSRAERAEADNAALLDALCLATRGRTGCRHGDAPGHCHTTPGCTSRKACLQVHS